MEPPKITVVEEFLTPNILANKLKESPEVLLKELKEEKGIFEDAMQANTILAWDTVQRACEKRGFEVVDNYKSSELRDNKLEQEPTLNKREKEALRHCISFHKMYAELIVDSLPKNGADAPTTSKLAEYHNNISQAIKAVLDRVEKKEKTVNSKQEVRIS